MTLRLFRFVFEEGASLKKFIFILPLLALPLSPFCGAAEVSFLMAYNPETPEEPSTKCITDLAARLPGLEPVKWGGLTLPGAGGRAPFLLAMAGGSAPDIYKAWFHILRHDVEAGFCAPLDEWAGCDTDGDGTVSAGEAKWKPWQDVPRLWRDVATKDGHIWALPQAGVMYYGLVYRRDIVAQAGLDPDNPPRTWAEFSEWCVKLSSSGVGSDGAIARRALAVENRPWGWLPWVQSAGGDVLRRLPSGDWEAAFDSPAAVRAAEFLQSLIAKNCVRAFPALSLADDISEPFVNGEIVFVFGGEDFMRRITETMDFPPELVGLMPFPAADGGCRRVLQAHRHFWVMSESAMHRPKAERDMVWECLKALASQDVYDSTVRENVAHGRARWCNPRDLERLGFKREAAEIPLYIRKMYKEVESGEILSVTEPHAGFWQGASDLLQRKFLGILLGASGKDMDCRKALSEITAEANRGLMFDADRSSIEAARPTARIIAGVLAIAILVSIYVYFRYSRKNVALAVRSDSSRRNGTAAAWLFLLPALATIALWSYYPLLKGVLMAFQDYKVVGESSFAGLDNFIRVSTDPQFWKSWLRTLEYVGVTLILGFVSPVLLALALAEIPKGRIFFRMVYFLPHLTSALVVTLLWKMMFDPTENGLLNQMLAFFGVDAKSWLLDPSWAMFCCILPGVWAGMGMSSLIYIAALSSMPRDLYEAAAIDGAGIFSRLRHITLPQLAPLLVINFTGAFIAAFQGMGSIFLLTFGGPGDATNVLSLVIWKEAYNNLRFSAATTMAWYLGAALVGFTCLQIKFLRKVEFRQARTN